MKRSTRTIMLLVALCLLPGLGAMTVVWGLGVLSNVVQLLLYCYAVEVIALSLRSQPLALHLGDGTCLVTALLLAICLPPAVDSWILLLAAGGAIGLAKHAYGGTGRNIFNPAMVGYAMVLVTFPEALSHWPNLVNEASINAYTGATQLTHFLYRTGMTTSEFTAAFEPLLSRQQWIAMAFGAGGVGLLMLRLINWRIPAAVLAGVAIGALFGYDQGSSASDGGLVFHTFSGGLLAAAFFVATDPVTHPHGRREQWLFGITIGLLSYLIRAYGVYPDGIAFAVLLANCATPLLDRKPNASKAAT